MFERLKKWRDSRPKRLNLADLDPHQLRDIGLDRHPFGDDPQNRAAQHMFDAMRRHRR